jgi:hypothetical protein
MERRSLLRYGGVVTGVLLAGCTGSTADQGTTLSVANVDFYGNDAGFLEVAIVVSNAGNHPETGTLLVHATINGDARPRVREVSLDAHATKQYTIEYDVQMANVQNFDVTTTIEPA